MGIRDVNKTLKLLAFIPRWDRDWGHPSFPWDETETFDFGFETKTFTDRDVFETLRNGNKTQSQLFTEIFINHFSKNIRLLAKLYASSRACHATTKRSVAHLDVGLPDTSFISLNYITPILHLRNTSFRYKEGGSQNLMFGYYFLPHPICRIFYTFLKYFGRLNSRGG